LLFGGQILGGIIKEGGEMASGTETKLKNEQEEFENVFEILRKQLLAASVNLYIWEQLFPTEKVVDIINQYKGFFLPTRAAHLDGLILKVSDIRSTKPNAPSFYRILNMIGINSNLAPDINVREIKKRLRKHKKVVEAIRDYRDKRVAHWDTSFEDEEVSKPLLLGTKKMLGELEDIFNEISASHSSNTWAFRYAQQGDTTSLLEALRKKRTQDEKLIEYLINNKRYRKMILSLMMDVK
jgi:hypothetical protein